MATTVTIPPKPSNGSAWVAWGDGVDAAVRELQSVVNAGPVASGWAYYDSAAKGDARWLYSLSTAAGSSVVTAPAGTFLSTDVGKSLAVEKCDSASVPMHLYGVVSAVAVDGTTATVTIPSTTGMAAGAGQTFAKTATSLRGIIGTNDTATIKAETSDVTKAAKSGTLHRLVSGRIYLSAQEDNIEFHTSGAGFDWTGATVVKVGKAFGSTHVGTYTATHTTGITCIGGTHVSWGAYDYATHRTGQDTSLDPLVFVGSDNMTVRNTVTVGSRAAGHFWSGCHQLDASGTISVGSLADGHHVTGPTNNARIRNWASIRPGDDGGAVVGYNDAGQAGPNTNVVYERGLVVDQQWGRGISIVGGYDCHFYDVKIVGSNGAAAIIGIDGNTFGNRHCSMRALQIEDAHRGATTSGGGSLDQAALFITGGVGKPTRDLVIDAKVRNVMNGKAVARLVSYSGPADWGNITIRATVEGYYPATTAAVAYAGTGSYNDGTAHSDTGIPIDGSTGFLATVVQGGRWAS